jgi:TonB family protein
MKIFTVFATYVSTGMVLLCADTLACIRELRVPEYPLLARQARITGKATVSIKIDQDGKPNEIVVEGVHKLLQAAVADAMEQSHFSADCGAHDRRFEFHFELEGAPKQTDSGRVLFRPPSVFVIRAASFPVSGQSAR